MAKRDYALEQNRTEQSKKAMLAALEKTIGVVTPALERSGVGRTTYYEWLKKDESFLTKVTALEDVTLDFAEHALHKLIQEGNTAAVIFYLKTRGKKRGFVERVEQEQIGDTTITINKRIIGG